MEHPGSKLSDAFDLQVPDTGAVSSIHHTGKAPAAHAYTKLLLRLADQILHFNDVGTVTERGNE